jgi:TonB-linked SusC/RagA family outer membrane protein
MKKRKSIAKSLLLCLFLTVFALSASAQKVTLSFQNETFEKVLSAIRKQTSLSFILSEQLVDLNRKVSINVNSVDVQVALKELLDGTNLSYEIKNDKLYFVEKKSVDVNKSKLRKIVGTVTDKIGETLIGVTIIVKGSSKGTVTDVNGQYKLEIPEQATLQFSSIGMGTETVSVGNQSIVNVVLKELSTGLNEVVVVGYGSQKKTNLTGAVSQVKFDDMGSSRPMTSVSSALAGLSSGVSVKQTTGQPGSDGASILIRGAGTLNNSAPLVIVDGMEGSMDNVNPQDIESISILKDAASSAIYGSRAANGVILVTTKTGSGKKLNVTYTGMLSSSAPVKLLNFVTDYPTYMQLENEAATNIGSKVPFSQTAIDAWKVANAKPNELNSNGVPNYVAFPNTNWNEEMYKNYLVQEHGLSVNGSTSNARFLLSVGYLDNPGLVENTGMKRYSFRTNADVDVTKWLTVGTRTYGSVADNELGNYANVLNYAFQTTPGVYPKYNGVLGAPESTEESATANNLYAFTEASLGFKKTTRMNATAYSKVKILPGLSWDLNFNYNKYLYESNSYTNPQTAYRVKFGTGIVAAVATSPDLLQTNFAMTSNNQYTLENLLRYQTTLFQKHHVTGLLGYNESFFDQYNTSATMIGLYDANAYQLGSGTTMYGIDGSGYNWALRSFFGRVNYDFDNKYLFEANLRYDGSSRFSSTDSRRWGVFPSFSAGWRIIEEPFMKNQNIFQNLKLRGSWGQLGNNSTRNASGTEVYYGYMPTYTGQNYSFNGNAVTSLAPSAFANAYLKWESTTMTNFGVEAAMLRSRLTVELDAYSRQTNGILTTPPSIITLGTASAPVMNLAAVSNKGIELTLGWQDKLGEIQYSVKGNVSYNKNEVTKYKGELVEGWTTNADGTKMYSSNLGSVSTGSQNLVVEGHQINEHFLYNVYKGNGSYTNSDGTVNVNGGPKDGMIRTSDDMTWLKAMVAAGNKFMPNQTVSKTGIWYGDYIYADLNGDGVYGNSYDRKLTNTSTAPTVIFGLQMNASWKGLDLSLSWSGQAGNQIYWLESGYNSSSVRWGCAIGQLVGNNHYYYNDLDPSSTTNNTTALYPRLKYNETDTQNKLASDRWLYNGAYLRLKNLTLGYTLPQQLTKKIYAEKLRVFLSTENVFTITSFPGLDPEMASNTNYPVLRQIAFGTNITF